MAVLLKNIKDFGNGTGLESRQCINLIGRDLGVSSINIIPLFKIIELFKPITYRKSVKAKQSRNPGTLRRVENRSTFSILVFYNLTMCIVRFL